MDYPSSLHALRGTSLRQLQVFEAVARHRSFSRAAEELFLAQPSVSVQVKKLSQALGLPLFEHIGKRIYLTEAGECLYDASRQVLDILTRAEMKAADLKGLKQGHLRLAVVTTAKYFAPRVLGVFCQRYPGVEVSLKVTNRERLLERLHANVDDLYIIGRPPESPDLHFEPFVANPLVVMAARNHPLAAETGISLARIAEEPFIIREQGSGTRMAVETLFTGRGLKPRIRMELGSNEAIKHAIAAGLGVAVLSRHTLALAGESGPLAILDVEGFPLPWHWYVGFPTGKELSVVARSFLDYLQGEGRAIAELPVQEPPAPAA